jgi:hypothetical protein
MSVRWPAPLPLAFSQSSTAGSSRALTDILAGRRGAPLGRTGRPEGRLSGELLVGQWRNVAVVDRLAGQLAGQGAVGHCLLPLSQRLVENIFRVHCDQPFGPR